MPRRVTECPHCRLLLGYEQDHLNPRSRKSFKSQWVQSAPTDGVPYDWFLGLRCPGCRSFLALAWGGGGDSEDGVTFCSWEEKVELGTELPRLR